MGPLVEQWVRVSVVLQTEEMDFDLAAVETM